MATMKAWIGTSGYSYPDWVGGFYPPATRPNKMLAHYCRHFPLVELNFTFYRMPTASMLGRLAGSSHDLMPLVEQAIHDALRAWQVTEELQENPAETAPVRE